jgi:NTP pyrophosphatase (non-canonical NTP hydrolase)
MSDSASLRKLQEQAAELLGEELRHPRVGAALALVEEVGELAKVIMEREIYRREEDVVELEEEAADILFSLFELCTAYKFSLEDAYRRKIEKISAKREKWIEKYSATLKEQRRRFD